MTRAVVRNSTTTINTGITVQASSSWLLPKTCGGSRPSSSLRLLNFTAEYTSRLPTTTNITAVTACTKSESLKIESAGVEAGEKILVEVEGWPGAAAKAMPPAKRKIARDCS